MSDPINNRIQFVSDAMKKRFLYLALLIGYAVILSCDNSSVDSSNSNQLNSSNDNQNNMNSSDDCDKVDCCIEATDCPNNYSHPSQCTFENGVIDCQGTRQDAVCNNGVCQSVTVEDDRGCKDSTFICPDHFENIVCTDEEVQPIANCKTVCESNDDCEGSFECNASESKCACPGGDQEYNCADNVDNDCDELIDCNDKDCQGDAACPCEISEALETSCMDDKDNDCDGLFDCEDTDCAVFPESCGLTLVGGIHISKVVPDYGSWTGACVYTGHQIYDKPNPGEIFGVTHHGRWFKAYTAGDCYFMAELIEGFCEPTCSSDEWCTPDDYCETLPVTQHAGTLTVEGLDVGIKTIVPDANGLYKQTYSQACFDVNNSYTSDSTLKLTAAGGLTSAFTLVIEGVDFMLPPLECDPNLPPAGQDYVFTWTPVGSSSAWVRLYLPTWHHAGMGSAVICEVPDSVGELTVPAEMIDYYLATAVPERTYSLLRLNRAAADIGNGKGVAFEVSASRSCDYFH